MDGPVADGSGEITVQLNDLPGHLLVERVTLDALQTFLDESPGSSSAVSRTAEVRKFGRDPRWVGRDTGAQRGVRHTDSTLSSTLSISPRPFIPA